jgi:hypothetical protein
MGANKRMAQIRRQKKQEAKRHRVRRPALKSLVAPVNATEAQWVQRQGTRHGVGGGRGDLEGAENYAWYLAYDGRCDDALKLLDEAQRRFPHDASITRQRANVRRLSGDLSPAVWRDGRRGHPAETRFSQPRWIGEPIPGQTLLLWGDFQKAMGIGDLVQMSRLAPMVKAHSQASIMLAVPAGMKRLMSSLGGVDAIVEPPLPLKGFEVQCPIPLIPSFESCALTPAWVSSVVPYLFAEDDAVERWAQTFADRDVLHIGLHWQAVHSDVLGHQWSVPLSALAPLFSLWGTRFYSLQYDGSDELKAYPEVVDLGNIDDPASRFVETAAVMKHLDLLIACDSGPAHVAGACGTKVFLLLPVASDVRWGLDRKTVWYPGHTLWHDPGRDWQIPVWEIRDAVERLVYHRSICRRP